MREAVRAFGLLPIEQRGYEADDIIATYARQAVEAGADATIVAGDKDLMQLVRPGVRMFDPMPGRERPIGRDEVIEKFGVPPEKVPEVQALIGDSTDNVPGVPGIGAKRSRRQPHRLRDPRRPCPLPPASCFPRRCRGANRGTTTSVPPPTPWSRSGGPRSRRRKSSIRATARSPTWQRSTTGSRRQRA